MQKKGEVGLTLRTYVPDHFCKHPVYKNPRLTYKFIENYFRDRVMDKPTLKAGDMVEEIQGKFKCKCSIFKCKRAKTNIVSAMFDKYKGEYNHLEAYCNELMFSNPGSFAQVEISGQALKEGRRVFKRVFICLKACKEGWKNGCRPLMGLDGCFLKAKNQGQLLVAMGKDAADHFFPIAWAIVDRETKCNWEWFLTYLQEQLDLGNGEKYTAISDMQKGLLPALANVLPECEHRFCARHVVANWRKLFPGSELHKWFWICAWSSFEEEFRDNLNMLGKISKEAGKGLMKYPPRAWCRAYFSGRCNDWTCDNNFTESFNAWVKDARHKPIIRLLEDIRTNIMKRMVNLAEESDKWMSEFAPNAIDALTAYKSISLKCKLQFNGEDGFEVTHGQDRHVVRTDKFHCSCRVWQLTGIPCAHACAALDYLGVEPEDFIRMCYHKTTYNLTYREKIQPVRGKVFWRCDEYEKLEPPPVEEKVGRPKLKRTLEEHELNKSSKKQCQKDQTTHLSKKGEKQRCGKCGGTKHNARTCQAELRMSVEQMEQPMPNANNESIPAQVSQSAPAQVPGQVPALNTNFVPTQQSQVGTASTAIGGPKLNVKKTSKGIGISYDDEGNIEFHTGESEEEEIADPEAKKLPIPDERRLKWDKTRTVPPPTGTRKIEIKGNGIEVPDPSDLPFKEPALMWRGRRCLTTRQLLALKEKMQQQSLSKQG